MGKQTTRAQRRAELLQKQYAKYVVHEFEGRRIYTNTQDFTLGKPTVVNPKYVHASIRKKIENGATNLDLMKEGNAPIGLDGKPINLHHSIGEEPGPMIELLGSTHQLYHKPLHGLIEDGRSFRNTPALENKYESFRKRYWKWRANNSVNQHGRS